MVVLVVYGRLHSFPPSSSSERGTLTNKREVFRWEYVYVERKSEQHEEWQEMAAEGFHPYWTTMQHRSWYTQEVHPTTMGRREGGREWTNRYTRRNVDAKTFFEDDQVKDNGSIFWKRDNFDSLRRVIPPSKFNGIHIKVCEWGDEILGSRWCPTILTCNAQS